MNFEEYRARFKARMLARCGTFADGSSVGEYADEIADSYWQENDGEHTPEEDADSDIDEWEPE